MAEDEVDEARQDARRFRLFAHGWRVFMVVFSIAYWFASQEPPVERLMLVLIAALSIQALVATYDGKAEAAMARAAGHGSKQ